MTVYALGLLPLLFLTFAMCDVLHATERATDDRADRTDTR